MNTDATRINEAFDEAGISMNDRIAIIKIICDEKNISFEEGMDTMEKIMKKAYDEAIKNS